MSGSTKIKVVGGAEVQQSLIAPGLAQRGYRVSMISLDYGQPDRAEVAGVTIYNMHRPDEGIPGLRFLHPRLTSLWRVLSQVDADIYYQRTAAAYTGFLAHFCRRHARKSIYAGASDVDFRPGEEDIRFARDRKIFEWGVRRVDRVVTQNAVQQRHLMDNYGREGVIIPSCYVPPPGSRSDRGGYVLWTATPRSSKRAELALEIARRLPDYRFMIVGGPDPDRKSQEHYAALATTARALPNVEMKGFVPFRQAEHLFDGARVVLNTSRYEGFPNTFLQAWSRGTPTVAFIDTGSRTKDGEPVYDIARDIVDATSKVDRLMRDDIAWREASSRVLAHHRDNHAMEAIIDRYAREITGLVGS